jgi:hypothetical protein
MIIDPDIIHAPTLLPFATNLKPRVSNSLPPIFFRMRFTRRRSGTNNLKRLLLAFFCLAGCEAVFFCLLATSSNRTAVRVGIESDSKALDFLRRLPRNVLFVEPFHGLGNRLRAYACAAALAKLSFRHLVVVWIQDPHVNASMSALFDTNNLTVIDFPVSHLLSQVWVDVKMYDYNTKRRKDEIVQDESLVPIYIRSA